MVQAREEELIDYPVIRYVSEKDSFVDDHKYTSMECYLDIYLNGKRFTTSFCSPGDHTDLVIGILAQMGQIRTYDDIVRMDIDEETLQATVVTTAEAQAWAAGNATDPRYFRAREILDCEPEKIFERPRDVRFKAGDILACADKLLAELAATHEKTNRHNVFDKLYGWTLRHHIDITDKIIIFSGRCSSEMMMKLGRMGISTVAAKSVPTTLSLALAKKLGITLVARMAPGSFCVYTNPERIIC